MVCHQIPLTNPYPGPRSVLVLDNCRIHHAEEIRHLVEDEARMFASFLLNSCFSSVLVRVQISVFAAILSGL
jgi:hypothetical protein